MLDRNSQLAVPDESYFIPQLADRHRGRVDVDAFVDDLRRVGTVREWEVDPEEVRARLRPGMSAGEAIGAVYETYAAARGKARWGDKTPMYMQHLGLLERLFPDALYVHLVRDGRDAAASFLQMPAGIVTESWGHPKLGRRLRLPVGYRDPGRAGPRPACRARALPRAPVRGARRVARGRARTDLLLRRPALGALDARLRDGGGRQRAATPAEPEATSDERPPRTGGPSSRPATSRDSRRWRATSSQSSATSSPTRSEEAPPARGRARSSSRTARRHGRGGRPGAPSGARPSGPAATRLSASGCPAG